MRRFDGRKPDALRPLIFHPRFLKNVPGSVLVELGDTRVVCTVLLEHKVPPHVENTGKGWLTSEYAMLPASTPTRKQRDGRKGGAIDGRTQEIQRLIGRAIRAVVDLSALPNKTAWIDCDVIEADGGTRTAAINGAWMALALAAREWERQEILKKPLLKEKLAAVSVGYVGDTACLDLCYQEDSKAEVDMNLIFIESGNFVEVQGAAEGRAFGREQLDTMLALGWKGAQQIFREQGLCLAKA